MSDATIDKTDTWIEIWNDNYTAIDHAFHWPYCQVDGYENRICLGVSERFCHPHSGGREADKLIQSITKAAKRTRQKQPSN